MKIILGVDVGGSTTKVVAFDEQKRLLGTSQVKASDQITSLYGAIGHLLHENSLKLEQVSKIVLTGVGSALITTDIYGIPTRKVDEFEAVGLGGLMLSGLEEALVVSMGTGTAFVHARQSGSRHVGGSGVGGGTLLGLASRLINESDIDTLMALSRDGSLENIDLFIGDISTSAIPTLPSHVTASNFGKLKSGASKGDIALGLINMVFQTAGVLAAFACVNASVKNVVAVGSLAALPQAQGILDGVGALYGLRFTVPTKPTFATAYGAAHLHLRTPEYAVSLP